MFGREREKPTQQALLMGAMEAPSPTVETEPTVSFNPIVPELGALRALRRINRGRLALIVVGAAVFVAGLAFAISFLEGKDENAARHGATAFAAALLHNTPSSAPSGADGYVPGVRHYFGSVTTATVYRAHNHSVNTGDTADTRTYFVVDMLLETGRGPAVLEIDFDNGSIGSDHVSSIRELDPRHAPGLNSAQRQRIETAFAKRGGNAADAVTLSAASVPSPVVHLTHAPTPAPTPAASHSADAALSKASKELSCVQNAHGDVAKMQRCTSP